MTVPFATQACSTRPLLSLMFFSAKQVRDLIPAGLLSAGRNVRILRHSEEER